MEQTQELYLLVESGPILAACREWQARYIAARSAAFDFARDMGAEGWFGGFDGELVALTPTKPILPGWHVPRVRRVRDRPRMMPRKGPEGDDARAAIAALPPMPKQAEVAKMIGHPCGYSYEVPGQVRGSGAMGTRFNPVQLFWPTADGPLMILCPNAAWHVARLRAAYPGCIITQGEWGLPAGVLVISEAKKDFLIAQAKVREEEAASA